MERWTIQDQVSLPYLLWRDGIEPGTFGIDQFDNDMVVIMAHAEELRNHRTTILELEDRINHEKGRADHFQAQHDRARSDLERLLARRVIRAVLALASALRPLLSLVRRR